MEKKQIVKRFLIVLAIYSILILPTFFTDDLGIEKYEQFVSKYPLLAAFMTHLYGTLFIIGELIIWTPWARGLDFSLEWILMGLNALIWVCGLTFISTFKTRRNLMYGFFIGIFFILHLSSSYILSLYGSMKPTISQKQLSEIHININLAPVDELLLLPMITERQAAMIDAYRYTYGKFKNIDDLKKVPEITPEIFDLVKDKIYVE